MADEEHCHPPPPEPQPVFRQPPPPPPLDQLGVSRGTVRALSAAANQGDENEQPTPTAHQGGARLRVQPKPSTKRKGKTNKKTGTALESEFESDTDSVLDHQSLGFGLVGLTNASMNGTPFDPEVQNLIPCRYNDMGFKEFFPDLTFIPGLFMVRVHHTTSSINLRQFYSTSSPLAML